MLESPGSTEPREPAITRQNVTPKPIDAHEPWMRGLHADTGYLLYRLGLRSGQLFNACLQESGLRLRHYAVLRFLAGTDGALQRELSARLGYDPSAIVGLVDDLEKLGFAERRPSPDDRRSRIVALTDSGRDVLRDTDEAGLRVTGELLGPLDPAERESLHALLLRIAEDGLN
ncbi:DNA-binding transcriptional regulator, MarR family [Streptomyces sp. Ag82_O1-12]|uniref:MarR family winged helix-turn-helix transcriptional regulator n=1 Tax=unclassified Streptomyces TaxID=2593676 RepID=UPI000BC72218|nr:MULTISPECIES: MarR family transcriptional regulator [unclassified Streptomyces]SMQ20318.1 DNA-binding transcriptional regulator, MarR family [Streptomyces sp. Ag82_O1-12]SOD49217.1 DNA-binding transcriptional regulator, MarR family [Streptomyces sp. Ag82_G6-1]